jgi:hypothetical protein
VTVELLRAPELIEVSAPARLLYLGMRILANDGVVTATAKQLHAAVLPGDELNVLDLLRDLQAVSLIVTTTDPPGWMVRELDVKVVKAKKQAEMVTQEVADRIKLVWSEYTRIMGKPRAVLDDKRRAIIRRALDLYTAEDLSRAITGYTFSPFHMGENDRNKLWTDIELLLRDAKHIDEGLDLYEKNTVAGSTDAGSGASNGRSKSQGHSPHQRWNALEDGAPSAGGLPGAGESQAFRSKDTRGVVTRADAGKQPAAGPGIFDGVHRD